MGTNSGRYSKFQERLKRIVRSRLKRKKNSNDVEVESKISQQQFINDKVIEINTVMFKENNKNVYNKKKIGKSSIREDELMGIAFLGGDNENVYNNHKKTDISDKLDCFGIEVITKIRSSFEDKLDRLEVMESELYLINYENDNTIDLVKLKELKEKISKLIEEINKMIDEYNLYNKNYYMDNFIGLEDKIIEDDIINYRNLLDNSNKEKDFVKEYKMLDEFNKLYYNLILVKQDTEELCLKNEEKIVDVDIRDMKYKKIVDDVCKIDDIQRECIVNINLHNKYLEELVSKLDVINRKEYINRHLNGLGELISQSLKFIGLKMLSPLSGIVPSIAVNTLITKELIGNIYNNLHYEEIKHIYYSGIDYDRELVKKITDIGYTENLIDNTLNDIKKLKVDFISMYNSNIPGYSDTLKKINGIENSIYRNQNKVNIIKKKLKDNRKINEDKMIKVKRLNENRK